jgi:hypothetical protein
MLFQIEPHDPLTVALVTFVRATTLLHFSAARRVDLVDFLAERRPGEAGAAAVGRILGRR